MQNLNITTKRGAVLQGALFSGDAKKRADTVMIAITGIHGNFYSNPFYYTIGQTLNNVGYDFIYAQTNDAFGRMPIVNAKTGKKEYIGSWNERFSYTDEDIDAYLNFAVQQDYSTIILAGHSLGANKVIYYLSRHHDSRVAHFFLLSPANLSYLMRCVTDEERMIIKEMVTHGQGNSLLPFDFMGWIPCVAYTAFDWAFSGMLNNVFSEKDGDFSQCAAITHITFSRNYPTRLRPSTDMPATLPSPQDGRIHSLAAFGPPVGWAKMVNIFGEP